MSEVDNQDQHEHRRGPLPPPSFTFLALSLKAQAEVQLGLMYFEESEKPEPDLDLARHTIDMIGMLQEKTKGNLTLEEQRFLENSLTELRFRFVQVSEEQKEKQAGTPKAEATDAPEAESQQA